MKLPTAFSAPLSLLIALTAVAAAQTPPPLKMGLWEHQISVQMSGMPSGSASTHNLTHQSCFTSDSWKNAMQEMQGQRAMQHTTCSTTNMEQDSRHISFDVQCSTTNQGYLSSMHIDMHFDSPEAMHGSNTVKISGPGMPQGMTVVSTVKSKWVSSDCGDVKPIAPPPASTSGTPPS